MRESVGDGGACELRLKPPRVSGEYVVSCTLHGQHVRGSPHAVLVLPPGARPERCGARGEGLAVATSGEAANFTLYARDARGVPVGFGGEKFAVAMQLDP